MLDARADRLFKADRFVAATLVLMSGLVYAFTIQRHSYGDGMLLLRMAEHGSWELNKILYRPLYEVFHAALALVGFSAPEQGLMAVSIVCASLACGFVYLAARTLGNGRAISVGASLLMGFSPTVWFFATCIEVHAPQLLVAAFVCWGLSRSHRLGTLGQNVFLMALYLCALAGTHLTGLLWVPALAGLCARSMLRGRQPRGVLLGLVVLSLLGAALYLLALPSVGMYERRLTGALQRPSRWDVEVLFRDLGLGAGMLGPLGLVALVGSAVRGEIDRTRLALGALACAPFLIFLPIFRVYERGAYYISLFPVLSLGACLLARASPRVGRLVILLAVPLQVWLAGAEIHRYQTLYSNESWIAALEEETGGSAAVLVGRREEGGALLRFSSLLVIPVNEDLLSVSPSDLLKWVERQGLRIVIMRTVLEDPRHPLQVDYVRALIEVAGDPIPGRYEQYFLLPAPD